MVKIKKFLAENWFLILALIYVLSPIDILPDQFPFFGTVDDASLLVLELIRRTKGEPKTPISSVERELINSTNKKVDTEVIK